MGDPCDFTNFMCAVIDKAAFETISGYIDFAKSDPGLEIICGGGYDDSQGYFIEPTVVLSKDPKSRLMSEEIFGPVLTIHVYPEAQFAETLDLCNETSPYALTGAIFAQDRSAVVKAGKALVHAAGNFYINDKPHRRRRRPAALRRQPRLRNQRQSRVLAQPRTLGVPAHH